MRIYLKGSHVYAAIPRIKDADKLAKYYTETNQELGIQNTLDKKAAVAFIKTVILNFNSMREFHFGIYTKNQNRFIGLFSIIQPDYSKRTCEIGYWIAKRYRKKGYGEDAIEVIIDFAFKILKMKNIFAFADTNNKASTNLLKSIGFKRANTKLKSTSAFDKKNRYVIAYALRSKIWH